MRDKQTLSESVTVFSGSWASEKRKSRENSFNGILIKFKPPNQVV